jgi:midasin (ATPase involved in ribosome maturation)
MLEGASHISLRNLARSLNYIKSNYCIYGYRAVYDGLYLGFGTGLTKSSRITFDSLILKYTGMNKNQYSNMLIK